VDQLKDKLEEEKENEEKNVSELELQEVDED
jgi:hypothetical protein